MPAPRRSRPLARLTPAIHPTAPGTVPPAAIALAALLAWLAAPPAGAQGPTLATEDTMRTDVSTVLVKAPRVTLEEILDRVARGEARRDSLLHDQSFTATLRVMRDTEGKNRLLYTSDAADE